MDEGYIIRDQTLPHFITASHRHSQSSANEKT
jgi:hypothetical protein